MLCISLCDKSLPKIYLCLHCEIHYLSEELNCKADDFHGEDGLHGCAAHITIDENEIEKQHAVDCIIDLATKHKGEVSLVALGPLTNLALAIRLQPDLPNLLKDIVILGGNYTGLGNQTASAEFNFAVDPLAANIVISEYTCPITVVPWETALHSPLSPHFIHSYGRKDNARSSFFKDIMNQLPEEWRKITADPFPVCIALDRQNIVGEEMKVCATVEVFGQHTRGMMVVDRRPQKSTSLNKPNIMLVTRINMPPVETMLLHSVS